MEKRLPSKVLLEYLYRENKREINVTEKEKSAIISCYMLASKERSSEEAIDIIKDCIALNDFSQASYLACYLLNRLKIYLNLLPKKPKSIIEDERLVGFRMRYNPSTKSWEDSRAIKKQDWLEELYQLAKQDKAYV